MARGKWALWLAVAALISIGIPAYAGDKDQKPDLTGQWQLDVQRSDMPQRPPGGGGYGGGGGHGGWGGHEGGGYGGGGGGGWGGHEGGGGGHHGGGGGGGGEASAESRPVRLPDLMHVTMTPTLVSFEDSTGAVVREVATVSAEADTFAHAPGALHVPGEWKGDKLVIEREGPRGKVTETISLEDKGASLVLKTKMEGNGEMPSREFKRVYRKVVQSG